MCTLISVFKCTYLFVVVNFKCRLSFSGIAIKDMVNSIFFFVSEMCHCRFSIVFS